MRPADKFFHWIQQGVPVRIEVGPRDVKKRSAIVARRDIREKNAVPVEQITQHVVNLLEKIQQKLFERALNYRKETQGQPHHLMKNSRKLSIIKEVSFQRIGTAQKK